MTNFSLAGTTATHVWSSYATSPATFQNNGPGIAYLGPDTSVSPSTGTAVQVGQSVLLAASTDAWGCTDSGHVAAVTVNSGITSNVASVVEVTGTVEVGEVTLAPGSEVAVSGTVEIGSPVSLSGPVSLASGSEVLISNSSIPVTGAVDITNSTLPIAGNVTIENATVNVGGTVAIDNSDVLLSTIVGPTLAAGSTNQMPSNVGTSYIDTLGFSSLTIATVYASIGGNSVPGASQMAVIWFDNAGNAVAQDRSLMYSVGAVSWCIPARTRYCQVIFYISSVNAHTACPIQLYGNKQLKPRRYISYTAGGFLIPNGGGAGISASNSSTLIESGFIGFDNTVVSAVPNADNFYMLPSMAGPAFVSFYEVTTSTQIKMFTLSENGTYWNPNSIFQSATSTSAGTSLQYNITFPETPILVSMKNNGSSATNIRALMGISWQPT